MATKIYPNGTKTITVAASASLMVYSSGGTARVYERAGYPNHPDAESLLGSVSEKTAKVFGPFTSATEVRIDAGEDYAEYETAATLTDIGTKNGSTVSVVENLNGKIHTTVLTLTATPITITDDAGVAQYGGAGKIYDFPPGAIGVLGAVVDGDLTLGTTGTIINTYAGGVSLGTVTATTGATLTSTEADIMAENDVAAATAKVAAIAAASTGMTVVNGTATAKDAYLNFVIDDDATHTSGTGTFTGTVTINWINLGDVA